MGNLQFEQQRLAALRLYRILDTAAEEAFDNLTRLAAAVCDAPISLISFVDEERQWFKSRTGTTLTETPREHSFCSHAILKEGVMVVPDATKDARFKDNPLVTQAPRIRFYAAAPLKVADGWPLGTLCVIDYQPRKLSTAQKKALLTLRDNVTTQIAYRRACEDIKALESLLPQCAWCRKVQLEGEVDDKWVSPDDYVSAMGCVSHGICPTCRAEVSPDGEEQSVQ